eukprot:3006535-Amphidinium_carterae.1
MPSKESLGLRSVSEELSSRGGCATSRCEDWGAGAGSTPLKNLVLFSWIRGIPGSPETRRVAGASSTSRSEPSFVFVDL